MAIKDVRTHQRASRRAFKVALLVIVVALVAAFGVALARPTWVATALKGRIEEVATKAMGRPVTIGAIEAKFLPVPGAMLSNLKVEGAEGEPPFLQAETAKATVRLWPLIRSLGREVRIGAVEMDRATLNLVRRADGTWNYEDLQSSEEEAGEREVWVDRVALTDSELVVLDNQAKGGPAAVALSRIDLSLTDVGPEQTMTLTGAAALSSREQNVTADMKIESVLGKPEDFAPAVKGRVNMHGVGVSAFKKFLSPDSAQLFTGGLAKGQLDINTTEEKHYALTGSVNVEQLQLRGEPASGSFNFASTINPANSDALAVKFDEIAVKGPGLALGGKATFQTVPMALDFEVKGPLLDLEQLLSALPPDEEDPELAKKELLPPDMRAQLSAFTVTGELDIDEVRRGKLVATAVKAKGELVKGVFKLESGTAQVFGGTADLAGTQVNLNEAQPTWALRAKVNAMDVAQAFNSLSGHQALEGKANLDLVVDGQGIDWQTVSRQLSGNGTMELLAGALTSADLGEQIAPALAAGLRKVGKEGAAGTVENVGEGTQLQDLRTGFVIRDGFMTLSRPLSFKSAVGEFQLGGRIALDQRLDLDGKVTASPQFVSKVTRGVMSSSLPVPLAINGTLKSPDVKPGRPGNIMKNMARNPPAPVRREIDRAKDTAREKAKQGLGGALDKLRGK